MTEPHEVKSVTLKQIWQKIETEKIFETDLEFIPKYVPWMYISNLIQRTVARIVVEGPYGPVTVKATKEGNIAVAVRGGAFDDYQRLEWAFETAGEVKEFTFSQQVERIDMFTYDGKADYQLTRDLIKAYGDKIELFEDSFYSLDFYTKKVKVTCKSLDPKEQGTNTVASAYKLIDGVATFQTNLVGIGDVVSNLTDNTYASVVTVDSELQVTISEDIFPVAGGTGKKYTVEGTRVKLMGWFRAEG